MKPTDVSALDQNRCRRSQQTYMLTCTACADQLCQALHRAITAAQVTHAQVVMYEPGTMGSMRVQTARLEGPYLIAKDVYI